MAQSSNSLKKKNPNESSYGDGPAQQWPSCLPAAAHPSGRVRRPRRVHHPPGSSAPAKSRRRSQRAGSIRAWRPSCRSSRPVSRRSKVCVVRTSNLDVLRAISRCLHFCSPGQPPLDAGISGAVSMRDKVLISMRDGRACHSPALGAGRKKKSLSFGAPQYHQFDTASPARRRKPAASDSTLNAENLDVGVSPFHPSEDKTTFLWRSFAWLPARLFGSPVYAQLRSSRTTGFLTLCFRSTRRDVAG